MDGDRAEDPEREDFGNATLKPGDQLAGLGAAWNAMLTVCCLPPSSLKERLHEMPAAYWATVGGHG